MHPGRPGRAAKRAGLQPGDRILTLNGTEVTSWEQLSGLIRANEDGRAVIVYERDEERRSTTTNTTVSPRPDLRDDEQVVEAGFLGVAPTMVLEKDAGFVVATMGTYTWETVKALGEMPVKLVGVARAALGLEERAADGPMSVVGASRSPGGRLGPRGPGERPVRQPADAARRDQPVRGHVQLHPAAAARRRAHRRCALRGGTARHRQAARRPARGYFDVAKLLPVAYVMAGVILVMSVVLIYADIVAPVRLG